MDDAFPKQKVQFASEFRYAYAFIVFLILGGLSGQAQPEILTTPEINATSKVRTIQLAMFQYEHDHGGKYPDGKSSTEVFQKLVDGQYLTEMDVYYIAMPGKTAAKSTHLSPQNVCFDVTLPISDKSSDDLPTVFATGYRMAYKLGGSAVPLTAHLRPEVCKNGLVVSFHNNTAEYKPSMDPSGEVAKVIPTYGAELSSDRYVQLTPDGPLATK